MDEKTEKTADGSNAGVMPWQPMETAPKGYPSLEDPSEWFMAWAKKKGPAGGRWAIVRRTFHNGFGPWQGTGDEQYKKGFFSHWMPLPEPPEA